MRNMVFSVLFACLLALPAAAQTGQQNSPNDPLSTWLRTVYTGNRNNLLRSAERMPEEL